MCLDGLSEFRRAAGFSAGATALCSGYLIQLPGHVPANYHGHLERVMEVPWTYPDRASRVFALTCAGIVSGDAAACTECAKPSTLVSLQRVVARASDPGIHRPHTTNEYLTPAQEQVRFEIHQEREFLLRLKLHKAGVRPVAAMSPTTDMKRILVALATGKAMRMHVIAKRLLKKNAKPSAVVRMVEEAADGYVPRGERTQAIAPRSF